MQISCATREWRPRAEAVWDVDLSNRQPDVSGPYVGLANT